MKSVFELKHMVSKAVLALVICVSLSSCAAPDQRTDSLQDRYESFQAIVQEDEPDRVFQQRITLAYREAFAEATASASAGTLAVGDLRLLFDAKYIVCFYTSAPSDADDLRRILDTLDSSGGAADDHYSRMFETYVQARMFDQASALLRSHRTESMEALPALSIDIENTEGSSTELVVDGGAHALSRRIVALPTKPYIVVVSHPLCHFSMNASAALGADPALADIFRRHAKWLAPADGRLNFDALQSWNKSHVDAPISIAHRATEWPMIDTWATPTFYFIAQGQVQAKVVGWPSEGHLPELREAARNIGLLELAGQ